MADYAALLVRIDRGKEAGTNARVGLPMAASAVPCGPSSPRLLDHAVRVLVEHLATSASPAAAWRLGPLVVVSSAENAASHAVRTCLTAAGRHDRVGVIIERNGRQLDREIAAALEGESLDRLEATLASGRLVVVDRLDRVRAAAHRQALVRLFDSSVAAGATWCVSVRRADDEGVGPPLASRLSSGLVVQAPLLPAHAPAGVVPSLGRILRASAQAHDVPAAALSGPARTRAVSTARSLAMYLARRLTTNSFQAIGAACGGRDHTTVMHGVRVCGARIARDPAYAADVERVVAALTAGGRGLDADRRRSGVGSMALVRRLTNRRGGRRRRA